MNVARRRVLLVAIILFAAAALLAIELLSPAPASLPARPVVKRPPLLLLTSLPLLFSEQFSLAGGSPAVKRLDERYKLVPISVTDPKELAQGRLILMAHPLAQPPEDLVALDEWPAPGRSDAGVAEQATARRSATAAADVHGYRLARALGIDAQRPRRARSCQAQARRLRCHHRLARLSGWRMFDHLRCSCRPLQHRKRQGYDCS
jgi:hypothetical protein